MSNIEPKSQVPIAVVGVSAIFPGSTNEQGFWQDILAGRDLITDVPPSHWLLDDYYDPDPSAPDKTYARRGAFLKDIGFDPMAFGVPPNIIEATDTSQLLALIVAQRLLDEISSGDHDSIDREKVSVILGVTGGQELFGTMVSRLQRPVWVKALREAGLPESKVQEACQRISDHYVNWQESTFPGVLGNVVAGRIANRLDLHGTNCITDAACASTFSAVSMAVNELYLGQSDLVLTGGVDTMNDISMFMCFSKTTALSLSGDCRPFSDQADGTMMGEGLGMVALKRLADAERDGDRIYAVLQGIGTSSDGRSKSVYAPVAEGQARALRRAYLAAGYDADTVELVEAHGTGTTAGDAAEFEGLRLAFDESGRDSRQWCALGSVKSQIGHTKAAAGSAGLFKMVMALHHKVLPPTLKVERPNPKLELETSPFYLNTQTRPWVRGSDHPRRASVSSFGFGGSHFHLALEEYTGAGLYAGRKRAEQDELVVLGADSSDALLVLLRDAVSQASAEGALLWLARSSQESVQAAHKVRAAVVAADEEELAFKLSKLIAHIGATPTTSLTSPAGMMYAAKEEPGSVAFLFPGQGSQYLSMGADAAMTWPEALAVWDAAADLDFGEGERLPQVVFPAPVFEEVKRDAHKARLLQTQWAQPAIGATSLSLLNLMTRIGVRPDCVGGHSFGEITALCAAGVLEPEAMLRVARRRGELMGDAAKVPGSMVAVSAPLAKVKAALGEDSGVVVANHNSPRQVVLSGPTDAVDAASAALSAQGLKVRKLSVATAFHSKVVSASVEPFGEFLKTVEFQAPRIPVYANSKAAPYPAGPDAMRAVLSNQIASSVWFVEQIEAMYAAGVRTFVEVGPGSVLTNLVGQILEGRDHRVVPLDRKGANGVRQFHVALGQLWVAGVDMDLAPLWEVFAEVQDPRTIKQPRLSLPLNGSNHGKPYPPEGGQAALPLPNPEVEPEVIIKEVVKEVIKEVRVEVPVAAQHHNNGVAARASFGANGNGGYIAPKQVSNGAVQTPTVMQPAPALDAWLAVYQESQRQTAEVHSAWQSAMTQGHLAYLHSAESSFNGLTAVVNGPASSNSAEQAMFTTAGAWAATKATPDWVPVVPPAPQVEMRPAVAAPVVQAPAPSTVVKARAPQVHAVTPTVAVPSPKVASVPSVDLQGLLLEVVAEKTGYPADMLTMDMALESDLGIDSIKRVEILSAMTERAPGLPEVDTNQMASLSTLGQIADHMEEAVKSAGGSVANGAVSNGAAKTIAAPLVDLQGLLLEVVAEKTGYPADMLTMDMALESDLGIDSIKRVEILSAMTERAPGLPEVDTNQMASLSTLGQIAEHMESTVQAAGGTVAPVSVVQNSSVPSVDLKGLLLEVVAEKTGYPADMLTMDMALESDLGIDSIKRVEILSAMTERAPGLPEVDTNQMAALSTLGQIVEHMESALVAAGGSVSNGAVSNGVAKAASVPSVDLKGLLLEVVAEKTGYPADMLTMDMALESDLGIDSIKRVEILSAMTERAPGLPEVDTNQMAALSTLGQIVEHMQGSLGGQPASAPSVATQAVPSVDLQGLLLEVVAEKTGYPADMLTMDMALESDLGIDSIKRVEILSAMTERAPGLPEVDTNQMAALSTLGQIVEHMQGSLGGEPTASAVALPEVAPVAGAGLGRYVLDVVEAPALGFAMAGLLSAKRVVVVDGEPELANALATALNAYGVRAEAASTVPKDADAVISLAGLSSSSEPQTSTAVHLQAFTSARAVAARLSTEGGAFVTVQDTGGDLGLAGNERAWLGGLTGLVKTAAQEWPLASVKAIDIDRAGRSTDTVVAAIAEELLFGGPELEVGLGADGRRITVTSRLQAVEGNSAAGAVDSNSVIVASGGARGVTAATLVALGQKTGASLALWGRTPLTEETSATLGVDGDAALKKALLTQARAAGQLPKPAELGQTVRRILAGRDIRATLATLEAAGCRARYMAVDVRDDASVANAVQSVREQWGPITGIVHGAGVLADKLIADKTDEQFDRVFATKVEGLANLLAATTDDPLSLIALFSSVAGRSGNSGQCDYAMANEVLNKVAGLEAARRKGKCVVKSLGWGPWEGGMVTPALKAHFEAAGVALIPLEQGAQMLIDEVLASDVGQVEVVLGGAPTHNALIDGAGDVQVSKTFDVLVDGARHPFLRDHAVQDMPVLPVVFALEWFLNAARATCPDLEPVGCRDLNVLRGVRLDQFDGDGNRFQIVCTMQDAHTLKLALHSASSKAPHYTAVVDIAPRTPDAPKSNGVHTFELGAWDASTYGETSVLFHGPSFQAIQSIEGISDKGMASVLCGAETLGWPGHWSSDAAALDGALQCALLWADHMLSGLSLPTRIGAFRTYESGPLQSPVRCVVRGRIVGSSKAVCDIALINDSGDILAELVDTETHLLPRAKA